MLDMSACMPSIPRNMTSLSASQLHLYQKPVGAPAQRGPPWDGYWYEVNHDTTLTVELQGYSSSVCPFGLILSYLMALGLASTETQSRAEVLNLPNAVAL